MTAWWIQIFILQIIFLAGALLAVTLQRRFKPEWNRRAGIAVAGVAVGVIILTALESYSALRGLEWKLTNENIYILLIPLGLITGITARVVKSNDDNALDIELFSYGLAGGIAILTLTTWIIAPLLPISP